MLCMTDGCSYPVTVQMAVVDGFVALELFHWVFTRYFQQPRCCSELQADTRGSISLQRLSEQNSRDVFV